MVKRNTRSRVGGPTGGDDAMMQAAAIADAAERPAASISDHHEQRLERMIDRLPGRLQTAIRWLRRPSLRWVRVPVGVLLIAGSFASVLPFFGLWMLPLGLALLAEDIAPLRRVRGRFLDWIERHRPHWFTSSQAESGTQASPPPSPPANSRILERALSWAMKAERWDGLANRS